MNLRIVVETEVPDDFDIAMYKEAVSMDSLAIMDVLGGDDTLVSAEFVEPK